MEPLVKIRSLVKRFDDVVAVNDLNLDIYPAEFFTLLGPSGCGKTTTLRMVGGLEEPDWGEIYLEGTCISSDRIFIKPEKRDMGMVFQSYALWPHKTVFENVAYPLKVRRAKKAVIREKVREALRLVGLEGLEDRPAPALSGGQQQRVALARALVFSPRVLLLDEPLSNLDAKLRDEMRRELKALHRRVGVAVLFVTHDQVEALSVSDRVGIMNKGRLEQVGSPEEVYHRPATGFARDFLGKTFALEGRLAPLKGDLARIEVRDGGGATLYTRTANLLISDTNAAVSGCDVTVAIRPEQILVSTSMPDGKTNILKATVDGLHFLGDRYECTISLGSKKHILLLPSSEFLQPGQQIFLELRDRSLTVWQQ